MTGWTKEHRAHVGKLIKDEMKLKGWKPAKVAARLDISADTVARASRGDDRVSQDMMLRITHELGIPDEDVLPPRPPRERSQLDQIEAMLRALAKHLIATPGEEAAAVAEVAALLRDLPQTSPEPPEQHTEPKDQEP